MLVTERWKDIFTLHAKFTCAHSKVTGDLWRLIVHITRTPRGNKKSLGEYSHSPNFFAVVYVVWNAQHCGKNFWRVTVHTTGDTLRPYVIYLSKKKNDIRLNALQILVDMHSKNLDWSGRLSTPKRWETLPCSVKFWCTDQPQDTYAIVIPTVFHTKKATRHWDNETTQQQHNNKPYTQTSSYTNVGSVFFFGLFLTISIHKYICMYILLHIYLVFLSNLRESQLFFLLISSLCHQQPTERECVQI
jgi:hypothetical protein